MNNLFKKWGSKHPKYNSKFKNLFDSIAALGGKEGNAKVNRGVYFSTQYELYIYAFFLGLYEGELTPIEQEDGENRVGFSNYIKDWGSKNGRGKRNDFIEIQEFMFVALVAETEFNFIDLEKGIITEDDVVKELMHTLESYTNGGLILIKEKREDNPNYFTKQPSFLNFITQEGRTATV